MQMQHVKAGSQHFVILHEKCYLRKAMHLDIRTTISNHILRNQDVFAGEVFDTQVFSKMTGGQVIKLECCDTTLEND